MPCLRSRNDLQKTVFLLWDAFLMIGFQMIRVRHILTTPKKNSLPNIPVAATSAEPVTTPSSSNDSRADLAVGVVRARLVRGLSATALSPIVTAVIQLSTVPCLLHFWGAAKYGDWLILSAIPSYLSLSDLGFGDASGSDMTMRVAAGDRHGAIETFQSSWVLLTLVSSFVGLLATAAVWAVPWHQWIKLSTITDAGASTVVLLFGAYLLVSQQCGILESGFRCDGNFATGNLVGTLIRLFETAAGTTAGCLTGNLVWTAATYLAARIVGTSIYALLLHKKSSWLALGFSRASVARVKQLA